MKASSYVTSCFVNDRNVGSTTFSKDLVSESNQDALDKHSASYRVPNPLKDSNTSADGVKLNLRKRTFKEPSREDVAMSSYNSAFLSGLFADIAKANEHTEAKISPQKPDRCGAPSPYKKSRLSMTKSISRCEKSFANLQVMGSSVGSRRGSCVPVTASPVSPVRNDSLSYQLHIVSSASSNESETVLNPADVGKIAFPHLPATVSNSSCPRLAGLTRRNSGQPLPESETDSKESYGWFVTMDDDRCISATSADSYYINNNSSSTCDLAFSAATAPKSSNHDAEVEWAKAADTVDDVLGDFF